MQKVVYISNSRDFTEQNDVNDNKYLVRINKLLEDGWECSCTVRKQATENKR